MHWLDSILAVPTIGIRAKADTGFAMRLPGAAAPLAALLEQRGALSRVQGDAGNWRIEATDGRVFGLSADTFSVQHSYALNAKRPAGGLPELEPLEIRPFSELLSEVRAGLGDMLDALWDEERVVDRIGIVANMHLRLEAPPPGVSELIAGLGKPLDGKLVKTQSALLAILDETKDVRDQCHHHLSFDAADTKKTADESPELTVMLDWQRLLKSPAKLTRAQLASLVEGVVPHAMRYFTRIGEGRGDG